MKLNVAVFFGGCGVEHEVSIISAHQCINALNHDKYQVTPIYVSKQGLWYTGKDFLCLDNFRDLERLQATNQKIIFNQNCNANNFYREPQNFLVSRKPQAIDVAFPVMHGAYGEDGSIQGLFELMNIPYVGSDVLASALTMDKIATKMVARSLGIKVLDEVWFHSEQWFREREDVLKNIKAKFSYPVMVKPGNLGSSIGVSVVRNDNELEDAVDLVVRLASRVIVEPQLVNLREINCSVLGDHSGVEISACEEPIRSTSMLSYQDKYAGGGKNKLGASKGGKIAGGGMSDAKREIPAKISKALRDEVQEIARRVFFNFNCHGVVRIDFLLDKNTNDIYFCEVNSIPGSLAFYLWDPVGKSFTDLLEDLVRLALKRHRENSTLVRSYAHNILGAR